MISRPAQYLIRFDDLCPTASLERFERFMALLANYGVQPILAVVPDNRDPTLITSAPDPRFWPLMRQLEASGATIALHGYRHLCTQYGRSLLPLHRQTEFAGASEIMQRRWIAAGMAILRAQELNPRLWVAPRHGFDGATLRALRDEGLGIVSDGFARQPFTFHDLTWIPQQLWAPVEKRSGLWTICLHTNTASAALFVQLDEFLRLHAPQFTSVERALAELDPAPLSRFDQWCASLAITRIRLRRWRKKFQSGS